MHLVDAHAHLQSDAFAGDLDAVLARAAEAGVEEILVPGWDFVSSTAAVALARRIVQGPVLRIHAAAGIHPHAAAAATDDDWAGVVAAAGDPAVVAVGETGLDYDRMFSPRDAQMANLRRHLALACQVGKPAILHCRSAGGSRQAQDDLLAALRETAVGGPAWSRALGSRPPVVLHSFSGPADYAQAALDLGAAISFSALVFRAGEEGSREVARLVPADRLLVETDSPWLPPPGRSRRRNEPAWVGDVASWLAGARGADTEQIAASVSAAFRRLIGRA